MLGFIALVKGLLEFAKSLVFMKEKAIGFIGDNNIAYTIERKIDSALVNWLDAKLSTNGLAQHAIDVKDARLLFGLAAEACVGVHESGGNNQGPMVELFQKTIGRAEGEPWCMAFVQSCLAYAELKTGKKSPVYPTEHCRTCWVSTPHEQRVKISPLKYAIIIWGYEGTSSGHCGVVLETNKMSSLMTCEGNSAISGSREGDCVGYHQRDWIRSGSLVKLGMLKPF